LPFWLRPPPEPAQRIEYFTLARAAIKSEPNPFFELLFYISKPIKIVKPAKK